MKQIDEWNPVYPKKGGSSPAPAPTPPPNAPGRPAPKLPGLVESIRDQLLLLSPAPAAVHFYKGEGLDWIRVGFDDRLLEPADVEAVGRAIEAGLGKDGRPLYFHALRSYDLLFFLEHFDPESTGMPPRYFGALLDDVLAAWWPAPAAAGRKRRKA